MKMGTYRAALIGSAVLALALCILTRLGGGLVSLLALIPGSIYVMHRILEATPRPWNEPFERRLHLLAAQFVAVVTFAVVATLVRTVALGFHVVLGTNTAPYALIALALMGIYYKAALTCDAKGIGRPTPGELLRAAITFGR